MFIGLCLLPILSHVYDMLWHVFVCVVHSFSIWIVCGTLSCSRNVIGLLNILKKDSPLNWHLIFKIILFLTQSDLINEWILVKYLEFSGTCYLVCAPSESDFFLFSSVYFFLLWCFYWQILFIFTLSFFIFSLQVCISFSNRKIKANTFFQK